MANLKNLNVNGNLNVIDSLNAPIVGITTEYVGNIEPPGWLICDGRLVSKDTYRDLYDVIGIMFGEDGNDFRLPQFDNHIPLGWKDEGPELGSLGGSFGDHAHTQSHDHPLQLHRHSQSLHNHGYEHAHTILHKHSMNHTHNIAHSHNMDHDHSNVTTSAASAVSKHAVGQFQVAPANHTHTIKTNTKEVDTSGVYKDSVANNNSYGSSVTDTDNPNRTSCDSFTGNSGNSSAYYTLYSGALDSGPVTQTSLSANSEVPYLNLWYIIKY